MSFLIFLIAWIILKNNSWFSGEQTVATICLVAAIVFGTIELCIWLFTFGFFTKLWKETK